MIFVLLLMIIHAYVYMYVYMYHFSAQSISQGGNLYSYHFSSQSLSGSIISMYTNRFLLQNLSQFPLQNFLLQNLSQQETVGVPKRGYVYAIQYWEQQSSSSFSLLTLQCWAGKLNATMSVIEPFYLSGWPKIYSYLQNSSAPRFRDLFHLETWNNLSKKLYQVELVPWSDFAENSPTNLITVEIIYWWNKSIDAQGLNRTERISFGCKWNLEDSDSFFNSSFQIVRRACINFSFGDKLTLQEFSAYVFGNYSGKEVSVIFKEWRGISPNPARIPIDRGCYNVWFMKEVMGEAAAPSSRMLEMASEYKQQYLHNSDYIAVMVRMEKAVVKYPLPYLQTFLDKVLNASKNLQYQHGISNVFVSIDIGQYGSSTLMDRPLIKLGLSFFTTVMEQKISFRAWERSFKTIAKTADPGVIARLQSTIVAQSTCAVVAGGGMFQFHTILMYHATHGDLHSCLEEIR